jgi:thiol-disulfide isomerase/thioredoxin
MVKILKEVAITLAMLFVISSVLNYIRKPNISNQIPNIKVQLIDGREVNLRGGEPLVLHFWATWCPTCKLEAPNLESLKNSGVRVITVAVNSGNNSALKVFMKANGYSYDVVNDTNGKLADRFNVEVFPTTFIYDGNGTLQFAEIGYSTTLGLKARVNYIL